MFAKSTAVAQFFWPGANTAWHFGQRISVKLAAFHSAESDIRTSGSASYDAMTLALSILRPIYFFAALTFAHLARWAAAIRLRGKLFSAARQH